MGFMVDKATLGQEFAPITSIFPVIHSTDCSTLIIIIRGQYIGQIVADIPSGLSPTPLQESKKKKKELKSMLNSYEPIHNLV
jgi:hypothetical protein